MSRIVATAVAAALATAVPSAAAPSRAAVPCSVIAATRAVADPVVYCLSVDGGGKVVLHRWIGRGWTSTPTGVRADTQNGALALWPASGGVVFSTGRRVYVQAGSAPVTLLYEDGRSIGVPTADITPYVGPESPTLTPFSVARAQAATVGASVYTGNGIRREVLGAPTWTTHFIVPPDFATRGGAIAIGSAATAGLDELSAFVCSGDFTCVHEAARLSHGYPQEGSFLDPTRGTAYVEILANWRSIHWRTDDFGETWQPWTSLNDVVSGLKASTVHGAVRPRPGRPAEMYARFVARDPARGTPDEIWVRSTDTGRTWRVVGRGFRAGRGANTLPYVPSARAAVEAEFEVLPDGTLLVGTGPIPRAEHWRYDGTRLRR